MRITASALAFLLLFRLNDALGACFFHSGILLACGAGLVIGLLLGYLIIRWNPNWFWASRLLMCFILVSLLAGGLGLNQTLAYAYTVLEPSGDWKAVGATGQSLFLIEAMGLFLAYRHWTPRSRLPDLDDD